jgi:hypothetical protein
VTRAEAERLLEAIEMTADEFIATIGRSDSAAVQAQCVGMAALKEHLLKSLDFRDFASDESQVDDGQIRELVDRYCRGFCLAARVEPPGQAPACMRCPLRHISIDPMLRQTSRAGGG